MTLQHKMFFVPYTGYVLLDADHPLNGRVFVPVAYPRPGTEPCLTQAKFLVPTCESIDDELVKKALADPDTDKLGDDCMCNCRTCFEARTNYPH